MNYFNQLIDKLLAKAFRVHSTVSKEDKVGRNQACPCESGKKFKRCCG